MLRTAEFWVLVSFAIFIGGLVYMGVPAMITKMLDDRAEAIRRELDEARRLREEAQALLAEYHQKRRQADKEAQGILDAARAEAEALKVQSAKALQEMLERRSKAAEEKIARAEAQALSDVRAAAVEAATSAAEKVLRARAQGDAGSTLVDQAIRDLKGRLN